jgi:hypothetical protein
VKRPALGVASLLGLSCLAFGVSCVGTTGGEMIAFEAAASGPEDAVAGEPLAFVSDRGFRVSLTKAKLHIGAIYLNRSMPVSGVQNTSCILPDTYVGQVTSGLDIDLLSPAPQPFAALGEGTTTPHAIVAQVWLTGGRIDRVDDATPILQIEGVAEKDGESRPFSGTVTIGGNRIAGGTDSAQAGASPICKQRIVSPIPVFIALKKGGSLRLRVDPRLLFLNVDFSALPAFGDGFGFTDDVTRGDQPSINLYNNLRAAGRLYTLEWVP